MNDLKEKERKAIEALRMFEPEDEPYYLAYSGGKDSDCIRILAQLAGVKHDIVHNLTTVDAPETMQYIKSIPNVIIDKARYADGTHKTMWNLIPKKKLPPTRLARYCCAELKERGGAVENLSWETGEDVMHWWISDVMTLQGQTTFDGFDILDV